MKTTRRNFIKTTGTAIGATALMTQMPFGLVSCAAPTPKEFGFQVWTIKDELIADFPGTLKKMAGLGYKQVEMCSPLGYTSSGFGPLNEMSGTEMKKIIDDSGLTCISSHYGMGELRESLDNRIEWATQLGMKQMICSSFWLPEGASVDEYRKAAEELNEIGKKTKAAGIQMGFHNHHMEFEKRGDELIYDVLMDELDPDLVKMQFQVAVISAGYKASDYFRKYPGRFISAHLADWSAEKETQVPIGQGDVDWKDFYEAAKIGGVQNYFVEMDPETFGPSVEFLSKI
ncbi:MAG: sugar phosphate isomerase/epimerase [Draconibacterium sp.]|nr:sugar phosphate isomerase/epimerase [Draconibacterium sp.]